MGGAPSRDEKTSSSLDQTDDRNVVKTQECSRNEGKTPASQRTDS